MKYLIAMLVVGLTGCAAYTQPSPTVSNYTGGQYDENGQSSVGFPYNTPHGGTGGAAL